jgi:hypothetical protein
MTETDYDPAEDELVEELQVAFVRTVGVLHTLDKMDEDREDYEIEKGDLILSAGKIRDAIIVRDGREAVPEHREGDPHEPSFADGSGGL